MLANVDSSSASIEGVLELVRSIMLGTCSEGTDCGEGVKPRLAEREDLIPLAFRDNWPGTGTESCRTGN